MAGDPFIIAIDGPAASGKGTLGRKLARTLGLSYLDTGLTYRAVAHALLQVGLPLDNEELAIEAATHIDLDNLDRKILSAHDIGEAASRLAVMAGVRARLVEAQRQFATHSRGAILDGRDIGTVVCRDADVKLYVTASPKTRAERRYKELVDHGLEADLEQILADIQLRDERDMSRENSPLEPAEDAHLIDTSKMDIETAFQTALAIVKKVQTG